MGGRWNARSFQLLCFVAFIILLAPESLSLNLEGLALMRFRESVDDDPYGALENWNFDDDNPCMWLGVHCVDLKVQKLDLKGQSLKGILAPELAQLVHLKYLILHENNISGVIPKEFAGLKMLELLDLRDNNLTGRIPPEIGRIQSLRRLLLCGNKLEGNIPLEIKNLGLLHELQYDAWLTSAATTGIVCASRKLGDRIWQCTVNQMYKADTLISRIMERAAHRINGWMKFKVKASSSPGHEASYCDSMISLSEQRLDQGLVSSSSFVRRKLVEQSNNVHAAHPSHPYPPGQIISVPTSTSSGAFPAIPKEEAKKTVPPSSVPVLPDNQAQDVVGPSNPKEQFSTSNKNLLTHILVPAGVTIFLVASVVIFCVCKKQGVRAIGPWKTGLSGQLQKALVTGVPKLNSSELETACEEFSNIIDTLHDCTMYKGTLSSGVEIAVASTTVTSAKDWSSRSELTYRKKVETLSRVNHKNFVNLLGYCEEDDPFNRMMVFEYAPNGTLYEHLHVKVFEHLDWNARMRIIMGVAYCLQYMHHDLNPPVSHPCLNSTVIYLTDDYAAKIAEISFWSDSASGVKRSGRNDAESSDLPCYTDPRSNIYDFGLLLLEIISGKLPGREKEGSILNWAAEYLEREKSRSSLIDSTLKSFKNSELDVICDAILKCIQQDPSTRPTIRDVISQLREAIAISPDTATPKFSPLWWAELEILSMEAG